MVWWRWSRNTRQQWRLVAEGAGEDSVQREPSRAVVQDVEPDIVVLLNSPSREAALCTCPPPGRTPIVNGVRIDPVQPEEALRRLEMMLQCPGTHVVNHVSADPTVFARRDPAFRDTLNRADLNVADGMGIVWACRALGFPHMRERVYGPDFMDLVCSWGREMGVRHYFYGAAPGIPERLAENLTQRYPGLSIAGFESPPYRPLTHEEEAEAAGRISESGTDILWLGVGTPKQQALAARLRGITDVRAIMTVGAAFDFLAGVKPQAPDWIQDHGLEWAFRLASEPRRLWRRYILGNPIFVWGILQDAVRDAGRRRSTPARS
jgi:N-acetylglucosaminyldiphosphoundecaprenol N-acetyl-beta-D-mannosaminyltransferase